MRNNAYYNLARIVLHITPITASLLDSTILTCLLKQYTGTNSRKVNKKS